MADELDDKDEFHGRHGYFATRPLTPTETAAVAAYLKEKENRPVKRRRRRTPWTGARQTPAQKIQDYPQAIPNTLEFNTDANKWQTLIRCMFPGCHGQRQVFVSDLFQIELCPEHDMWRRSYQREERRRRLEDMMGPDPGLDESVSNLPVTEELGGIRPAHLLIKAKNDSSWIEYVDGEGNTKFMQVHDVRSARDAFGRWAVYGIDQNGDPVHELYDLRHGYEHSGTFSGMRELQYGEIVKLAQQGVIRGEDGKPIQTLSGLMRIADEPLRALITKKMKEARAGGPSLSAIEKQLFAGPTASSAQKRRTGKAGTRPWPKSMSL